MDLNTLYHRTVEAWADRVNAVDPGQWDDPTPCRDWTVRDLVNHVVGEDAWTVPLVEGKTIADVGSTLDGDLLGDDPVRAALDAAMAATTVTAEKLPGGRDGPAVVRRGAAARVRPPARRRPPRPRLGPRGGDGR